MLRGDILSGRYQRGDRLLSTAGLAAQYKASVSTVHKALVGLAKEGWLERINGAGTFVAHVRRPFTCGGIYQGMDISSNEHPPFHRNLHTALLAAFARRGKETEVFVDTRPPETQVELFPALQKAITQQRIQALIAPNIFHGSLPTFLRLNVPTAFLNFSSPYHVRFDEAGGMQNIMQQLTARGCRSVGLISTTREPDALLYRSFQESIRGSGLSTREEWIRNPECYVIEASSDAFGYGEFMRFWRLPEKPDSLIIYPDSLMRGVITAILEIGWREVTSRLKLVLHRNAHTDYLCPFPALWVVSNEDRWADALVQMVEDQYEGRTVQPVALPFEFRENVPPDPNVGLA
jgi:DNA-binding LacI/PurR family transcriptional regulator